MHTRHRTVLLACALGALLAAVAVCAGAAAPARAATALPPRGVWASVIGSTTTTERWVDVAQGPNGSLYAGGSVVSGTASGTSDLWSRKFSANDKAAGHLLWSDTWDNPAEHLADIVTAIAVDRSGALIAVGTTRTATSGREWVVAKWSAAGAKLWQRTFAAKAGTAWNAEATDVVCTPPARSTCAARRRPARTPAASSPRWSCASCAAATVSSSGSTPTPARRTAPTSACKLALDGAGNVYCTGRGTERPRRQRHRHGAPRRPAPGARPGCGASTRPIATTRASTSRCAPASSG